MAVAQRRVFFNVVIVCAAMALSGSHASGDNWPAFRGDGRSVSAESSLPLEWGTDKNVRWRATLPGRSNGSPVVWGDRVFLLQGVDKEKKRTVMCFGRADGKLMWQAGVTWSEQESTHPDNPYGSGTPATDGERVIACFGSAGLICYDVAGRELWRRDLGKLDHMFGNAISPVIVGDLVVVNFGPGEGARLVAVDKRTGAVAWEAQPLQVDPAEQTLAGARLSTPAAMIANPIVAQGDKNDDGALSNEEMVALAVTWFDKLDTEKSGKLTREQFAERLGAAMPPPPGAAANAKADPALANALFSADADKDGSLTRDELTTAFAGWHAKWSGGKDDAIDANQVLDGLNTLLPKPERIFGGAKGPGGSWSTPLLIRSAGRDELIVGLPNRLAAYDPRTGNLLWFSKGLPDSVQPMPLWAEKEGLLIASGGDMAGGTMLAVRPGGSGDVTDSHRAWRQTRMKGSIGTGVVHDGRFYSVSSDGFALCADVKTGKRLWQKRLEAAGDRGSSWSSLLLAGDRVYVPNQSGDVIVLRAGREFEVLATNSLGEPTNASLAASGDALFLRTDKSLWCIGAKK